MKKIYLEGGRVLGAHGVRGVIKVDPWCDSPAVLAGQKRVFLLGKDGEYKEAKVLTASVNGPSVLMSVEGIEDRDAAIAMRGVVLYLHRNDIPVKRGAMLLADMIGLSVIDADSGRVYGTVKSVDDGVRHRIYTIDTPTGEVLFPAVDEFVKEIDPERGIFIRPIDGFFD